MSSRGQGRGALRPPPTTDGVPSKFLDPVEVLVRQAGHLEVDFRWVTDLLTVNRYARRFWRASISRTGTGKASRV
jgi:hypothetical protein